MTQHEWKWLEPHPQSYYKQLFVKGTRIRAEVLYGMFADGDPPEYSTPEEIAADMNLPLEAVREAIAYCEADPLEVRDDRRREEEDLKAMGVMDAEGNYIRGSLPYPPPERPRKQ
ncbi:MAG TPA: DUF433 domain-containing protein [Gemmataceae bacterium]|nr:DUF433 domain-containing protein [Gemmataceae bacterium]